MIFNLNQSLFRKCVRQSKNWSDFKSFRLILGSYVGPILKPNLFGTQKNLQKTNNRDLPCAYM